MRAKLISIGLCQFGLSILQTIFMFYYVKVYVNIFHVSTKWFTIAQTLFMIWNTINDPLFGYLQEVPGWWLNNRLSVIKYLSPFLVLSFVFIWIPWNMEGSDLEGVHLILALFFYDAFFSAIGVAWGALFADTTKEQPKIRVKALKYSQIAILLSVFSIPVIENLSSTLKNFQIFQYICFTVAIFSLICMLSAGQFGRVSRSKKLKAELDIESISDEQSLIEDDSISPNSLTFNENFKKSLKITKEIISEKKFLGIVAANFFHTARSVAHLNFASMIIEVVIPQDILANGSTRLSIFILVLTLGPQIVLILNEQVVAKIGAMNALQFSYIISFFSGFLIFFSSNPYLVLIFMILDSITVHTSAPLFNIIISDFVDEDARRNDRDSGVPSIIFSLNALFVKPAQSIAPVIIVQILNSSGYKEYLKTKILTENLQNKVLLVLFMTPLVIGAIQYLIIRFFYRNGRKNESCAHTV